LHYQTVEATMRHLTRILLALAILAGPAAGVGRAASGVRDLLLLKEAGLSDDILIDLIQSDGSVFHLKAADIIDLHKQGLSDRVIRAMLATARKPAAPGPPPLLAEPDQPTLPGVPEAPFEDRARVLVPPQAEDITPGMTEPQVDDAPRATWPSVPMAVAASVTPAPVQTQVVEVYVPVAVPVVVERQHVAPPAPPPAPVYWGYGGQKKPGSWDEPQAPTPPATKPAPPKGGRGGL
jgi:hypothetical protein